MGLEQLLQTAFGILAGSGLLDVGKLLSELREDELARGADATVEVDGAE